MLTRRILRPGLTQITRRLSHRNIINATTGQFRALSSNAGHGNAAADHSHDSYLHFENYRPEDVHRIKWIYLMLV